jgi:hypothetical protein
VPTRLVFRCQLCDAEPDEETYRSLAAQLQEMRFGEYVDAVPGGWLVWHGRGPYGPTRYACRGHRVALREYIRKHYGTLGWHPHARVLGDVPAEVSGELAEPPARGRRASARQRWLSRYGAAFPGRI